MTDTGMKAFWDLPARLEFIADWATHPGCNDTHCHNCRAEADLNAAAAILRSVFHVGDYDGPEPSSDLDDLVQLAMKLSDIDVVSRAAGYGHHSPVIRKVMHVVLAHKVLSDEVRRLREAIELHQFTVSSYVASRSVPEPVAMADEILYESLRDIRSSLGDESDG